MLTNTLPAPHRNSSISPWLGALSACGLLVGACEKHEDAPVVVTKSTLTITPGAPVTKVDITLETPAPGSHVRTVQVPFRGHVSGVKELAFNSTRVAIGPDGRFDLKVEIPPGRADVVVLDPAPNGAGKILEFQLTVDVDAPLLELTALPGEPLNGQRYERLVALDSARVTGKASDAPPGSIESLTVNGDKQVLGSDGSFQLDLPLAKEGPRPFEFELKDRAGNRTGLHLVLVHDAGLPEITIDKPATGPDGKYGATVKITGRVRSANPKCVWIQGEAVPLAAGGAFEKEITLATGKNTISIQAEDQAGRKSDPLELQLLRP